MQPAKRPNRLLVTICAVASVAVSFLPSTALADEAQLSIDKTAWFWMSNSKVTGCVGAGDLPSSPTTGVCGGGAVNSGVFGNAGVTPLTPGHLGVAMKNGDPDMRSYVSVALDGVPTDATVDRLIVTLTVALPNADHSQQHATAQGRPPATANNSIAAIDACLVRQGWGDNVSGGGGGDPVYSTTIVNPKDSPDGQMHVNTEKNEPEFDCSIKASGAQAKDGSTWTFDVANMANHWLRTGSNDGFALVPVVSGVSSTWTVEFHGPPLKLPAPAAPGDADPGELEYVAPTDAPKATIEFTGGSSPTEPTGPIDPGPAPIFPSFDRPLPPPDLGGGSSSPPIDTGGNPPALVGTTGEGSGKTPAWVLAMIPLLVLGVGMLSNMIGNDPLGLAFTGARSRVAAVLHERRIGGEGASGAAVAIGASEGATGE